MSRVPGVFRFRFFIDDVRLHPVVKNPLTQKMETTPWLIKDRENGNEVVETCETRKLARVRVALLNGRIRLVAEEGDGASSRIRTIGRL